jgi:hypothetical protein
MSLLWLKAKGMMIGGIVLAALAFFVRLKIVTAQRDKAQAKADSLGAALHVEHVRKKIIKEIGKEEVLRREDLLKEIKKDDKDYKGIDSLTNSNDW